MSAAWIDELQAVRAATLELVRDCDDPDLCAQPHPDFSPIGWHLGHIGFTEARWILGRIGGRSEWKREAHRWAQDGCPKYERIDQPPKRELLAYLREVRERSIEVLRARGLDDADPLLAHGFVAWFIAAHECQHRETIAVVRQLAVEQRLAVRPPPEARSRAIVASLVPIDGGPFTQGTSEFVAYDNERPAHSTHIDSFAIDRLPVSVAEWESFRADGGYQRPALWTPDGWAWRATNDVRWPRAWTSNDDGVLAAVDPQGSLTALEAHDPVRGISCFEAEAFARWCGARLPTEAEWECAARAGVLEGTGLVWEWTASAFAPYPGFAAFPYRGYSTPYFDGMHRVLRGGSIFTDARVARSTFRNFYLRGVREIVAGVRCVRSPSEPI